MIKKFYYKYKKYIIFYSIVVGAILFTIFPFLLNTFLILKLILAMISFIIGLISVLFTYLISIFLDNDESNVNDESNMNDEYFYHKYKDYFN